MMPDIKVLMDMYKGMCDVLRKADKNDKNVAFAEISTVIAMALDTWQEERGLTLNETNMMLVGIPKVRYDIWESMGSDGVENEKE